MLKLRRRLAARSQTAARLAATAADAIMPAIANALNSRAAQEKCAKRRRKGAISMGHLAFERAGSLAR